MKVKLEIIKGPQIGRSFEFTKPDTFLVGRAADANFRLPEDDPCVSRRHFHLEINPPHCIFRDLGSTNPPLINGKMVLEKDLSNQDVIEVGCTQLKVSIDKEVKTSQVKCPRCSSVIVLIDNEKLTDYCIDCLKEIEAEKLLKRKVENNIISCRCGLDLSDLANSDNRAPELKGKVVYSCSNCLPAGDREKGSKIAGYEVIKKIGEGGMGKVYLVYHRPTARILVCKKIPGITQKELIPRFEREIRLQKSLAHENIIYSIDNGIDKEEPFMISEFANAGDLNNFLIKSGKSLPVSVAIPLITGCLKGLEFMHSLKIIHRDIKPENILLHKDSSGNLIPKISDFGLAKSYNNAGGSSMTQARMAMGTLFFMAPEQMTDAKNVDERADIYSLGVSLYYLLTGKYPYNFPTQLDIVDWLSKNKDRFENQDEAFHALIKMQKQNNPMLIILSNDPIPIRERDSGLSPKLADIVDRAVEKNLKKRIQTAKEFLSKLSEI
jgi:eukaryotic-like serine/threonine-protein kinase